MARWIIATAWARSRRSGRRGELDDGGPWHCAFRADAAHEREAGHRIEAIQTWVALPQSHAEQEPTFDHYPADVLPVIQAGDATGVLISGSAYGHTSPVKFPGGICQLVLTTDRDTVITAPEAEELCLYVVEGSAEIDGQVVSEATMAILPASV